MGQDRKPQPPEMPPSPLTPVGEGAAQLHELFMSYVAAGFSRPEALEIVKAQVVEYVRITSEQGGGS